MSRAGNNRAIECCRTASSEKPGEQPPPSLPFGPYLQLLILTLQRRTELAGMRWDELAPDLAAWTVPAASAKNRKAQVVHLAPAARDILRGIPRIADGSSGRPSLLVFTTTGRTPISGFQNAKEQLDALAIAERRQLAGHPLASGVGRKAVLRPALGLRLHDLRRTGVTALARLGVPPTSPIACSTTCRGPSVAWRPSTSGTSSWPSARRPCCAGRVTWRPRR